MKDRKIGPAKRGKVVFDLTGIPGDAIQAVLDHPGRNLNQIREAGLKGSAAAAAKLAERRRARAEALRAINHTPGVYDRDSGARERILEAAGEWITTAELRAALDMTHSLMTFSVDSLWRLGRLEKRLNPGRAENRFKASGAAACEFQYRRAQKETAPGEGAA